VSCYRGWSEGLFRCGWESSGVRRCSRKSADVRVSHPPTTPTEARMAHIEKRRGKYRARFADRSGRCSCAPSRARPTRRGSSARCTPSDCADDGSIRATQTARSQSGLKSSCCSAGACRRRPRRPTVETSTSTSFRGSVPTGSASCQRTRSRTGSTTRSLRAGAVVGASARSNVASHAASGGIEAEDPHQPVLANRPASSAEDGDDLPRLGRGHPTRRRTQREIPSTDLHRSRQRDALE
jgi:hypothetical protein